MPLAIAKATAQLTRLRVVFLPKDPGALHVSGMLQPCALGRRYYAIGFGSAFKSIHVPLPAFQTQRFRPRQLSRSHTLEDACLLARFPVMQHGDRKSVV